MKHVILDTDIGGDPDDVFTLLFALGRNDIKIDLIVTNDEHQHHRFLFAKKLLKILKEDIPIVSGIDLGNDLVCVVCNLVKKGGKVKTDFVQEIKSVVEKNDKTYYVCVGAQSNLAEFLDKHQGLSDKITAVMMGGSFSIIKFPEHNIRLDTKAAQKVLKHNVKKKYVPLNQTLNHNIMITTSHEIYKRLLKSKHPAKNLMNKSFTNFLHHLMPMTFMHDPLTLATIINDNIIKFEKNKIVIDDKGYTEKSEEGYEALIGESVDYKLFMKLFKDTLPF